MKFEYKSKDFELRHGATGDGLHDLITYEMAADRANELLQKWIEESEIIYGTRFMGGETVWGHKFIISTHQARLIQVEEIKE